MSILKFYGKKLFSIIILIFALWQTIAYTAPITGPPSFGRYSSIIGVIQASKPNDLLTNILPEICDGPQGVQGVQGVQGDQGIPGAGIAAGGVDGQVLTKKGFSDYSTHWTDPISSVAWGNITGTITDQTDLINQFEPKNTNIQSHIGDVLNNPHNVTADQVLPSQTGQNGKILGTNGTTSSWVAGGGGTPGGDNRQVQYNNSGAFGGFGRYSANSDGGGCLIL